MTILGHLAAFALGVYLSIRLIAALYQVLDLWYRIGADYPRVIRGVLGWAATIAAIAWLLDAPFCLAFGAGLAAFLLFYLSLFQLRYLLIFVLREPADDRSTGANAKKEAGSAGTGT